MSERTLSRVPTKLGQPRGGGELQGEEPAEELGFGKSALGLTSCSIPGRGRDVGVPLSPSYHPVVLVHNSSSPGGQLAVSGNISGCPNWTRGGQRCC